MSQTALASFHEDQADMEGSPLDAHRHLLAVLREARESDAQCKERSMITFR